MLDDLDLRLKFTREARTAAALQSVTLDGRGRPPPILQQAGATEALGPRGSRHTAQLCAATQKNGNSVC